ncbi:MAG: hypothetical protein M1830_003384 [Pleopsidium flavum]|nr:MAG: hypothetical protein M1830_003384 [Pleopsidium flavum]
MPDPRKTSDAQLKISGTAPSYKEGGTGATANCLGANRLRGNGQPRGSPCILDLSPKSCRGKETQ